MRPRPRPRPITVRPTPRPRRPKVWSSSRPHWSQDLNIPVIMTFLVFSRAAEMGFKQPRVLKFFLQKTKTSKVQMLCFLGFSKNFKNPDFRLTVTAENCCLSAVFIL